MADLQALARESRRLGPAPEGRPDQFFARPITGRLLRS